MKKLINRWLEKLEKSNIASHGINQVEIFLSEEEPKQPQGCKFKHVINAN